MRSLWRFYRTTTLRWQSVKSPKLPHRSKAHAGLVAGQLSGLRGAAVPEPRGRVGSRGQGASPLSWGSARCGASTMCAAHSSDADPRASAKSRTLRTSRGVRLSTRARRRTPGMAAGSPTLIAAVHEHAYAFASRAPFHRSHVTRPKLLSATLTSTARALQVRPRASNRSVPALSGHVWTRSRASVPCERATADRTIPRRHPRALTRQECIFVSRGAGVPRSASQRARPGQAAYDAQSGRPRQFACARFRSSSATNRRASRPQASEKN